MKNRLHRINGGQVKYTVLDMFKRNDTGQSRMMSEEVGRESQGHGLSLGDILINIDIWSAESQIYAMNAV